MQWAELRGSEEHRVALDIVDIPEGGIVEVSTVFVGIDVHLFNEAPHVFETMVFGGALDRKGNRYRSWDEAVQGHKKFVKAARDAARSAP
jgi:hypothetical protein